MRFQGDVTIEAPRERAWAFLTDPRQVTQCAPDVQSLNVLDDQRFTVVVRAGVGPVKGTFTFAVMWLEKQAPERARVQARGKVPGSAVDMMTVMTLSEAGEGHTLLHWEADVSVKGVIASARHFADVDGQRTYFCCPACKRRFLAKRTTQGGH